jgi:hypothetical protein
MGVLPSITGMRMVLCHPAADRTPATPSQPWVFESDADCGLYQPMVCGLLCM